VTPTRTSASGTDASALGLLQICAAGALWGTGGLAVVVLQDITDLTVLMVSAHRMAVAAAVLLLLVAVMRRLGHVRAVLTAEPARVCAVGLSTAAYQALYFTAVVNVGVSVATVVALGLAPVLVTVWESVRSRSLPTPGRWPVLAAALTGLVLVSLSEGTTSGPRPALGIAAAVAAGTGYAVATVVGRDLARGSQAIVLTTAATTVGAAVLLPVGVVASWGRAPVLTADPQAVAVLLYLGVMTMALAYGLLYAGLRTTSGSAAVIATLVEPVTAALLAAWLLDERLGPLGVVGAVLILAAVAGLARVPHTPAGPAGRRVRRRP
jgi:drug/metabolite transporter, DME family